MMKAAGVPDAVFYARGAVASDSQDKQRTQKPVKLEVSVA